MPKPLIILVADDHREVRMFVSQFLERLGHIPILARTGVEALEAFVLHSPDVILLDVQMPEMDGYTVARHIRRLRNDIWTPIIFLSGNSDEEALLKGLEVGGDDYLTKPVSLRLLAAKIMTMQRVAEMQRQLHDQADELSHYHDENEHEQSLAKRLMDHIVRADNDEQVGVQRWMMPAQRFSGDLLALASTPSGVLHAILADGTGHGLAAALSVMPVAEIFYNMTRNGFSVSRIVYELNSKAKQLLPTGRFVTVTLVAINYVEQTIEIWNCGNPPVFFVDLKGEVIRNWSSRHPALGILGNESFDDTTEVFHWRQPGRLYLCSDGFVEAQNTADEEFGVERMMQVLTTASADARFESLRAAVCAHLNGEAAHDDVSLLEIDCVSRKAESRVSVDTQEDRSNVLTQGFRQWNVRFRLSASELQSIDIVPLLIAWMEQVKIVPEQRGQIFLVLSELFTNALDHGVLELDSRIKELPDGFEEYMRVRTERLSTLRSGSVEIEIGPVEKAGKSFLKGRVKDSGRGFDHEAVMRVDITQSLECFGRGIALVREFCENVTYLGNGNEVIVHYPLS